ncbi:MAG: leucine--tRNA ligase [Candidatus Nomurabacteria bacterium]|jgi:leucyl-tRNA synthetase|nr:leucine--tRNA ligase [Candidatus Nomurabacteria bacterium]
MKPYHPNEIEPKWQAIWEATKTFEAKDFAKQPKMYIAEMFPYPSGYGLHVGHVRNFMIVDVLARFYRTLGHNVMRPFGYDTFGLPAENYAIKSGLPPQETTLTNINHFREQFKRMGMGVDWSREINTSDPEYYRFTQWIFKKLFEKGLAYQADNFQWWCPVDKTVLANEQVENGHCWRCGSEVEKKRMKQWFFKITAYADELLADIDELDWPEKIKTMQKNWIGKSVGAEVEFEVENTKTERKTARGKTRDLPTKIKVFTTRPDTIFGATFVVLAPEHRLISQLVTKNTRGEVEQYVTSALRKSEVERQESKAKTGVFTGSYALNPMTKKLIPIWVADYVLGSYGEGAVMAVPAHDERDFEFAEKFDLPIVQVIEGGGGEKCYHGEGALVNSGQFDGIDSAKAREEIVRELAKLGIGREKTTYKMRDWLISRQRYWGAPIPIAYDKTGKAHAIPDDQLPVLLPKISDYLPDDSGHSPLAKDKKFMKVVINGEEMTRESDTMDGYACSSWYLLRYADPHNSQQAWDKKKVDYWNPVDCYVGGDHAVAHLLYVRFWCKFFADEGLLGFREPVKKLLYNGYINAPDGKKMSKSKGNVIDPLDIVEQGYGADALRTYEMFIGPYDMDAAWSTEGLSGVHRFLNRVWTLTQEYLNAKNPAKTAKHRQMLLKLQHSTIKRVTEDLHRNSFNTAVAALMEMVNGLYKLKVDGFSKEWGSAIQALLVLLSPFAPHLASELFEQLGGDLNRATWPEWDEKYLMAETATVVVQVNGKLRGKLTVDAASLEDVAKLEKLAKKEPSVKKYLEGQTIKKVIVLPKNKLVNIVL